MDTTTTLIRLSSRLSEISDSQFFLHTLEKKLLHFRINIYMQKCFPHYESTNAQKKRNPKFKK